MILANQCVLNDRYVVQSVLGEVGPFDVNYLAWDLSREREVVVREYYPVSLAKREKGGSLLEVHDPRRFEYGLGAYSAEGLMLGDVRHAGIAGHVQQFKQNGTVYCVSEYVQGAPLAAYVKQQGGRIAEEETIDVTTEILWALQACHENRLFHGGISPRSVLLSSDGRPIILAYQGARYKVARKCDSLQEVYKPGFAAPEQERYEVEAGPWWDVFGAASVAYFMLTGSVLPALTSGEASKVVLEALHKVSGISIEVRDLLARALAFDHQDRPESAQVFAEMLTQARVASLDGHVDDVLPRLEVGFQTPAASDLDRLEKTYAEEPLDGATPARLNERQNRSGGDKHRLLEGEIADVVARDLPTPHDEAHSVQLSQYDEMPAGRRRSRERDLELLVAKMVRWQQMFVGFILSLVVVVLLLVVAFVVFRPGILQQVGSQPVQAGAQTPQDPTSETILAESFSVLIPADESTAVESRPGELLAEESIATVITEAPNVDIDSLAVELEDLSAEESVTESSSIADLAEEDDEVVPLEEQPAASDTVSFAPLRINPEVEAALERERQYIYYRTQADSLARQGFAQAALQWYRSALRFKESDAYVDLRIRALTDSLDVIASEAAARDSLAERLAQARDGNGIFVLPDVQAKMVDEEAVRSGIEYPIPAIKARVEGRVTVRFIVDEQGQLERWMVIKGIGWGSEDKVIEALQNARFEPAIFNGEPVKSWSIFSIVFRLNR